MPRIKLVLLPGLDGTGLLFQPLLRALPAGIDPIVITYPTDTALGYDELLPLVQAQLPREEPYVLLGESFGGPLSLRIAATRPAGLRGLILAVSFVSCPQRLVPTWAAHLVRPLPFRAIPLYSKIKTLLGGYATPQLADLCARALRQVAPEVLTCRIRNVVRVNVAEALTACRLPILYLQGSQDKVVPAWNLDRIQAIRPDVTAVRIPSPHLLLQTQPERAAQAIDDFVRRTAA